MAPNTAYRTAEQKIEEARQSGAKELDLRGRGEEGNLTELPESLGQLTQLQSLNLSSNQLTALPESLGQLTQLQSLDLSNNQLTALPEWLGQLTQLQNLEALSNRLVTLPRLLSRSTALRRLQLGQNRLRVIPDAVRHLKDLEELILFSNEISEVPEWIGELSSLSLLILTDNNIRELPESMKNLRALKNLHLGHEGFKGNPIYRLPEWLGELSALTSIDVPNCHLTDLPMSVEDLQQLRVLLLDENPLNPELAAAYKEGLDAVKRYLRAKTEAQVVLNEAKLILIGEGEVGKSCLLGALRGDPWEEDRPTTHGIEIKPVKVTDPATRTQITLNGWDFGGQRVYRPTHQLFFSAPAVYLVVWKPREGPQQGFVKEWIKLAVCVRPTAYRAERPDLRCSAAWRQRRCRRDERSGRSVSGSGGVAA